MVREFLKSNPKLHKSVIKVAEKVLSLIGKISPELLLTIDYRIFFHKKINLEQPGEICEKLCWLKLHSDTTLWTRCADKYNVRSYVEEKGLGHTLNKLYGVYNRAEDIDFDKLPDRYVIKSNNGGGGHNVLIVRDKSSITPETIKKLNSWLKEKSYERHAEYHYKYISPVLIAEEYLEPDTGEISLTDYKFYCINGKAHSVFFCSDRKDNASGVHYSTYDLNWNLHPECVTDKYRTTKVYPKPISFEKMIEYSEILAKDIPFVRVDWYEINGKPIFGEMTFTPGGGLMPFHTQPYLKELGDQCVLPQRCR